MASKRLVLVVDHDETSRGAAEKYLTSTARWHVRAANPSEALAVLGTRVFDAILVHLSPHGSHGTTPEAGVQVIRAARATRPHANVVVVGHHDPSAAEIDDVHRLATTYLPRPQPMSTVEEALRGKPRR